MNPKHFTVATANVDRDYFWQLTRKKILRKDSKIGSSLKPSYLRPVLDEDKGK